MNENIFKNLSDDLVPANYLNIGLNSRKTREKEFRLLIQNKKLPKTGWSDSLIEEFINYLSSLDSNNFSSKCGLGEREARIACNLVAKRHYNFGHGIGRSGDLLEPQPKAAGSSLLSQLTNLLILDLIRCVGIRSAQYAFVVPMATGMTINLCFLSLRKTRPQSKYVLWSRIDQKACFKSITTGGFSPIIIQPLVTDEGLITNVIEFEKKINILGAENILCIFSTTSCFAPRLCDNLEELSKISKKFNIPHVVNNAYGLQSTFFTHQIEQAIKVGNIDLFIQSTDKNLLVPVGGAIVAGFNCATVKNVAKSYVGRASSSQTLDVLMTLLSLGSIGYLELVKQRKDAFVYLNEKIKELAKEHNEIVFNTKRNPISVAITLKSIINVEELTKLGSMLFIRGISGVRVITTKETKLIDDHTFEGWGCHADSFQHPYLAAAAGLGAKMSEVDTFIEKFHKCLIKIKSNDKSGS